MHFTLVVLGLFLLSFQSFGQTLRMENTDDPNITYGNTSTSLSPVRTSSGDGSTFSGRFKTFMAVSSDDQVTPTGGAASDTGVYHISAASSLPQANNSGAITSGVFDVVITHNTNGNALFITALTSTADSTTSSTTEPSDWTYYNPRDTAGATIGSITSSTTTTSTIRFDLSVICGGDHLNCGTFDGDLRETRQIYIYLDDTQQTDGNTAGTPSDDQNGIYLELNISDNPPNGNATFPTITGVDRGDGALTIKYVDGTSAINDLQELRVCLGSSSFTGSSASSEVTVEGATGSCSITSDIFSAGTEGSITLQNLTNGETSYVSIALVDSYRFATAISASDEGTPLAIETLLDDNQCFIATAAYGGDHEVITFLRAFRDDVLMQNDLGRKFVDFYYETSPPIAKMILKIPFLREIVRPIVYFFYLMIKYWWFFVTLTVVLAVIVSMLMRLQKEEEYGRS
jgi:hypothetical protein